MNCANHPDDPAVAYCRTCGKALCGSCTRDVQGVIYCESCLAERMRGVQPQPAVYQQVADPVSGTYVPPLPGSGPNAALAGILSVFPGVGIVYCGQYAKGLAYMGIFVFLILGIIHVNGLVFGLGLGFFCLYQMIDAIRTAKAIQMGLPIPDPLGLSQAFGTGEPINPTVSAAGDAGTEAPKVPTGAVVLIALGILFLLETAGFLGEFGVDRLWPLILIGLGVWLFAKRRGLVGGRRYRRDGRLERNYSMMGPAVLVTLGTLFLMGSFSGPDFGRTWPVLLLVIGLVKLLEAKNPPTPPLPPPPGTGAPGTAPVGGVSSSSSEVRNG